MIKQTAGRGFKAHDFELGDEGSREGGFALIEQRGRLADDLCVRAGSVRTVDRLDTRNISVYANGISPGSGHKENVETFLLLWQRVTLHNDNYIFCHLAFPPL